MLDRRPTRRRSCRLKTIRTSPCVTCRLGSRAISISRPSRGTGRTRCVIYHSPASPAGAPSRTHAHTHRRAHARANARHPSDSLCTPGPVAMALGISIRRRVSASALLCTLWSVRFHSDFIPISGSCGTALSSRRSRRACAPPPLRTIPRRRPRQSRPSRQSTRAKPRLVSARRLSLSPPPPL